MTKLVYVQAQADHIASLSRSTPVAAIEELVWNALDADAREVRIDVITNKLGAVDAIRIADNGTGIDVLKADSTFGSLGGSWKRNCATTAERRRLHGRQGRGRFKAFALGSLVEWRTTVREGSGLLSYVIAGSLDNPGVFEIKAAPEPGPGTGTEVMAMNAFANTDSLLDAGEVVQTLAAKFAMYLKSYPDVRIYFNGLPVTPLIVQKSVTEIPLTLKEGAEEAKLEIIEWKRRFAGAGRIVFAGAEGFELYETASGTRSCGIPFTAYLISRRFTALAQANTLEMGELDPEVRMYLDAARSALKAHFSSLAAERSSAAVEAWQDEGSYPFKDSESNAKERKRFDELALELSTRLESFRDMSSADRAVVFGLLRHAMNDVKKGGLKMLLGK